MKKSCIGSEKCCAHCKLTTLTRILTLTFDKIRSLFKWKLELTKVMHCLNRSWIREQLSPPTD